MRIHLDILGGLAGDMFQAALLDAFPDALPAIEKQVNSLGPAFGVEHPEMSLSPWQDGVFAGSRFDVVDPFAAHSSPGHSPVPSHGHAHKHPHAQAIDHHHAPLDGHVPWRLIRERLQAALQGGIRDHALGIFARLADAEGRVHGVPVDEVQFHEVGAWDSVVDIVGAACLIDRLDTSQWSVSDLPLGGGRVRTAHGPMPVPTPATAELLRGFRWVDDGIAGERVTPTGAAILRYLMPNGPVSGGVNPGTRVLRRVGVGFGSRRLDGISNCVRVLVFDDAAAQAEPEASQHRELAVVEFEVDDQSAEDLALGLDRLRQHGSVFDVVQAPVFGKKGRMMTSVRLLARAGDLQAVTEACFRETTTIGLRHHTVRGAALRRTSAEVTVDGQRVRVKTVERPGGATAKAESDDALTHATHRARRLLRQEAERLVLQQQGSMHHE